jgi:hypothetical protein
MVCRIRYNFHAHSSSVAAMKKLSIQEGSDMSPLLMPLCEEALLGWQGVGDSRHDKEPL